jgi:hypothetical protein
LPDFVRLSGAASPGFVRVGAVRARTVMGKDLRSAAALPEARIRVSNAAYLPLCTAILFPVHPFNEVC